MTETQERIYSAAIWYKNLPTAKWLPTNIDTGVVVVGHRHADVIRTVMNLLGKRTCTYGDDCTGESVQGFYTNKSRFVDRQEAMTIAREAGQVISDNTSDQLYSEDLY
jgi:hypothetical protein